MSADSSGVPRHPRPSAVSLSCVFVGVTAFLTLTELITALMDWGTVGLQEALQPLRKELQAAGTDVATDDLLRYLRWVALALIPFTVSAMVFAVYAFRGDRLGRIMLSVLGVVGALLAMTGGVALTGVVGMLQATMLFVAVGALWRPDAGRWYAGLPPLPPVVPPVELVEASETLSTDSRVGEAGSGVGAPAGERPASVLTAGLVTILGSLAAAACACLYLAVYTFARAEYVEAMKSGPFSDLLTAREVDLAMRVLLWVSVGILPLAVAGLLGAVALLARRRIGRTATLVWAWAMAALGVLMLPLGLLAMAGAGVVIVSLGRDDARQWTGGTARLRGTLR